MTKKERITQQIYSIADELRNTDSWARVERLADCLEDITNDIEEL